MSDHFEDRIRDALNAEAEGVTADDELLQRVRSRSREGGRRTASSWLLVAAAIAVLGGLATLLVAQQDDEQKVDLANDPDATMPIDVEDLLPQPAALCSHGPATVLIVVMSADASEKDVAVMAARLKATDVVDSIRYVDQGDLLARIEGNGGPKDIDGTHLPTWFEVRMPAGTNDVDLRGELADLPGVSGLSSTNCSGGVAPTDDVAADPPAQLVAVTEQGRLVVVDTATGDVVRDLGGFDDPTDPAVANREGGAFTITGVALHPNGRDVYIETCCEPAAGAIFRVPLDGSVPISFESLERVAHGYGMDISADGRWLAYVSGPVVSVMEIATGDVPYTAESGDGTHDWVQVAINHDGSEIAIERALERDADGNVIRSDARRSGVGNGDYEELGSAGGRFIPIWLDGGRTLASAPAPGSSPKDSNVDATGTWIIEVAEDGRLIGRSEELVEVPGGPYLAADW